jgi:hypothetical protein
MNFELEAVLKNCLHHGAFHHQYARLTVRFGVNVEPFRMDPIRAALDGDHFRGSQLAACIPVVRALNQANVIGVGQDATPMVNLPGDESPPATGTPFVTLGLHGLMETTSKRGRAVECGAG